MQVIRWALARAGLGQAGAACWASGDAGGAAQPAGGRQAPWEAPVWRPSCPPFPSLWSFTRRNRKPSWEPMSEEPGHFDLRLLLAVPNPPTFPTLHCSGGWPLPPFPHLLWPSGDTRWKVPVPGPGKQRSPESPGGAVPTCRLAELRLVGAPPVSIGGRPPWACGVGTPGSPCSRSSWSRF